MKINKLLVLLAALSLGLSACNKSGDEKESKDDPATESAEPGESGEQPTESESQPVDSESQPGGDESEPEEEYDFVYPFLEEGTKTGFPVEELQTFLTTYHMDIELPSFGADDLSWEWHSYLLNGSTPAFELDANDEGTIGTDSLEDVLLALLTEAGFEVDSSDYDNSGYKIVYDNNDTMIHWYTYNGAFCFWLYAEEFINEPTTEFPYEILQKIHNHYFGYKPEFPLPVGGDEWYYGVERDDQSYYGYAYTLDNGEIGVNSIEDVYKVALEENGWHIDATQYDEDGYYASKDNVLIQFFTWDGEFDFYLYESIPE